MIHFAILPFLKPFVSVPIDFVKQFVARRRMFSVEDHIKLLEAFNDSDLTRYKIRDIEMEKNVK